ncbi:MAG: thermonuclease family protein [Tepidisphaeraceae bacterium]
MGVYVAKWDAVTAASRLRNGRRWRLLAWGVVGLILLSSLFDHLRAQNRRGDDWLRFDGHQFAFAGAIDGESIAIREEPGGSVTAVRLLGVASFTTQWDRLSARRLNSLLAGRNLILLLEPTQTRDRQDRLLAFVFTDELQPLSPQLVGEGLALDDRRMPFAFHGAVDQAESQARRKRLGLWATATWRNMPAWREAWFEQRTNLALGAF